MQVEWKQNFNRKEVVDASICYELVRKLSEDSTPPETRQALVNVSREEDSPTHGLFTWDDSVAAEKQRLREAGVAIRNLVVVHVDVPEPRLIRAIEIQQTPTRCYTSTVVLLSNEEQAMQLLASIVADIGRLRDKLSRYRDIAEAKGAIQILDGTVEELCSLSR